MLVKKEFLKLNTFSLYGHIEPHPKAGIPDQKGHEFHN